MLNFDEFKEYVQLNLADALPPGYENAKLTINEVVKNNDRHLTAITVLPEGQNVAPNIYLDGFYMEYQSGTDLDTIMDEMADMAVTHMNPAPEFENIAKDFQDFDFVNGHGLIGAFLVDRFVCEVTQQCPKALAKAFA